jgi:hypothetical protein
MKDKILIWIGRNRRAIGYTVGGLNLLVAGSHLAQGQYGLAMLWLVIGSMIVMDTRGF